MQKEISILIPVYNFYIDKLLYSLHNECKNKNIDYEIIVIDDCSEEMFKSKNRKIEIKNLTYKELKKNIGRAKIRNLLAKNAKYDLLLFLDCDSLPVYKNFVENYLKEYNKNKCKVIYGGSKYDITKLNNVYKLHYIYGNKREALTINKRKKKPYCSFKTNNFLIKKEIFNAIKINENFNKYGYEDIDFAIRLKNKNIEISHIDNPVYHICLKNAKIFLEEHKKAIKNLFELKNETNLSDCIKIYKVYKLFEFWGLNKFLYKFYDIFKNKLEKKLLSNNIKEKDLFFFDIYRLFYLMKISSNR